MKNVYRYFVVVAALAASWLSSGEASAQCAVSSGVMSCNSPYGANVAVEIRIGSEFFGNQWVVWKRKDNGACQVAAAGNVFGLTNPTVVKGSSLNDTIIVQSAIETHCGKVIGAPVSNGQSLEIRGENGGDLLLTGAPASLVRGGSGNDIVTGNMANVQLYGDLGDDDVEAWGTGNGEWLLGDGSVGSAQDGNDCLYDRSHSANIVACSGGTQDKLVTPLTISPGGHGPIDCEQNVTCCSWAHLVGDC